MAAWPVRRTDWVVRLVDGEFVTAPDRRIYPQLERPRLMTLRKLVLAALASLPLLACLGLPPVPTESKLFDAQNKLVGFVDFLEVKGGTRIRVHVLGVPAGVHGFNIHTKPACEPPSFASAGPIFNPPTQKGDTVIAGNLPDITAGSDVWADTSFDWHQVSLDKSEHGLFRNGGTSLIITTEADKDHPGAPGSGTRIACGIIKERPEER
jgi:Cu-Zn family superoxide dismutase